MVAVIMSALMLMGCSKVVEIPRADYEAASQDSRARYHIQMADGTSHNNVVHFTLTDSTIVMEKSSPTYSPHKQINETVFASRDSVKSISKYELARGQSFVALSGTFLFVMMIASLQSIHFD